MCIISRDKNLMASSSEDKKIILWDTNSGKILKTLEVKKI